MYNFRFSNCSRAKLVDLERKLMNKKLNRINPRKEVISCTDINLRIVKNL